MVETEPDRLNKVLLRINRKTEKWFQLDSKERLRYLELLLVRARTLPLETIGHQTSKQNGHQTESEHGQVQAGFDMLSFTGVIFSLIRDHISAVKEPTAIKVSRPPKDGRQYHLVSPIRMVDQFMPTRTLKAEIWTHDRLPKSDRKPGFCLVLGAGNQPFLAISDMMYHLFVERRCCILKHHPLRTYCDSHFAHLFQDLIRDGFVECVEADIEYTSLMLHSSAISDIHITGGTASHDSIVWGPEPHQQEANKLSGTPVLKKPITSELGCVTPWLVCSGATWSENELWHQAGQLAMAFTHNNSFNCLSAKVVVIDEDWPQADDFLGKLRHILKNTPKPAAYYPGAHTRYEACLNAYPESAVTIVESPEAPKSIDTPTLPWTLIDVDENSSKYALEHEAFSPVLAIYRISAKNSAASFLAKATTIANTSIWGSLSCTLLVHPSIGAKNAEAVDTAIHELQYGSIGLNLWTAQCFGITRTAWGAYPGNTIDDVGSGIGFVNNPFKLDQVEKSVVYAPFVDVNQIVLTPEGKGPLTYPQCLAVVNTIKDPGFVSLAKLIWSQMKRS